jgi:hypothetical protein
MGSFEDTLSEEGELKMSDKSKSIKGASDKEIDELLIRLRKENEVQDLVGSLRRKSTPATNSYTYEPPEPISTDEPIESMYHDGAVQDTLQHFGIIGMKWGRRRGESDISGSSGKIKSPEAQEKANRRSDVKNRRQLSDKDLLEKIGRLEKEKKLRELTDAEINPGKTATLDIMKSAGTKVATTVLAGAALYGVQAALTKSFNPAEMAKNMFFKK